MVILYADGGNYTASKAFEIKPAPVYLPNTGDSSMMMFWLSLLGASCAAWMLQRKKRSN